MPTSAESDDVAAPESDRTKAVWRGGPEKWKDIVTVQHELINKILILDNVKGPKWGRMQVRITGVSVEGRPPKWS